jgi:hypothetical protein
MKIIFGIKRLINWRERRRRKARKSIYGYLRYLRSEDGHDKAYKLVEYILEIADKFGILLEEVGLKCRGYLILEAQSSKDRYERSNYLRSWRQKYP